MEDTLFFLGLKNLCRGVNREKTDFFKYNHLNIDSMIAAKEAFTGKIG